jgi:hypothetical protein
VAQVAAPAARLGALVSTAQVLESGAVIKTEYFPGISAFANAEHTAPKIGSGLVSRHLEERSTAEFLVVLNGRNIPLPLPCIEQKRQPRNRIFP